MPANLQPRFTDETAARTALEAVVWLNGPACPHCGNADPDKIAKVEGKKHSHRPGLYYCNECKGQFTSTVGTVFERSKIPLTKWWLANAPYRLIQKGNILAPASPHARHFIQKHMVYDAPYPRGHGLRRSCAYGRRWWNC
jgi:transposase-like protein